MKKYFNIVRLYPTEDGTYDWTRFESEFLEMSGYDRWYSLRESNSIREPLDVFVMKDIDSSNVDYIRYNLKTKFANQFKELSDEAYAKYHKSIDKSQFIDNVNKAKSELAESLDSIVKLVNSNFTNYIKSNFIKLEF
jgi:hypothetical protein